MAYKILRWHRQPHQPHRWIGKEGLKVVFVSDTLCIEPEGIM